MRKRLVSAILVMGLSGIVAEILLLREMLITFYGNELSIGIILANWLILEAIGAFFIGKHIEYFKRKLEAFVVLTIIFSLSFPAAIYLARIIKGIISVTPGEGLGLIPILVWSFFILAPLGISHGALFTFGCKIYALNSKEESATGIGKVYIYETLGTIAGGIVLTYLLIPYFHSIKIALGISLLNICVCVYLSKPLRRVSVILFLLVGFLTFGPGADKIQEISVKGRWKRQQLVYYRNSIYGNVAVTKREEQYTFFSDGVPIIATPHPNTAFVEEFVHIPMLSHPGPKDVLILTGGAGGVINEILKYPSLERIDYAELDPLILKAVEKFTTPLTETELHDPRVYIKYVDGRLFVKSTPRKYDLVFVGLSNPSDLQVNRFFTREFFALVKKRLNKKGILVITLPGSMTYLGEELRNLNACILTTLKDVYPYVRVIPGDFNLFLASVSPDVTLVNAGELSRGLKERNLTVNLLMPAYIEYKLSPERLDWFLESVKSGTGKINRDFLPTGLFYSLSYWNALFSPYTERAFRAFDRLNLRLVFIPIFFFTLIFLFLGFKIRRLSRLSVPFSIATTGFAGMIFDLVLIFSFQALYGYVFHWIGLLVTALMAGIAVGGLRMTLLLERIKNISASFIKIEALIVFFSGMLPVIFLVLRPYIERQPTVFLQMIFLILSFFSGFLIGAQFPLANKIYLTRWAKPEGPEVGKTAGTLYGADLFGGWIGGIAGGVILLPVLGLFGTCMIVVTLKMSSLVVFTFLSKTKG